MGLNSTSELTNSSTVPTAVFYNCTTKPTKAASLDALLYIVIVLLFYAFSMIVLMIKYIRRERAEAEIRRYYEEFISRDRFQDPQYQNKILKQELLARFKQKQLEDGFGASASKGQSSMDKVPQQSQDSLVELECQNETDEQFGSEGGCLEFLSEDERTVEDRDDKSGATSAMAKTLLTAVDMVKHESESVQAMKENQGDAMYHDQENNLGIGVFIV